MSAWSRRQFLRPGLSIVPMQTAGCRKSIEKASDDPREKKLRVVRVPGTMFAKAIRNPAPSDAHVPTTTPYREYRSGIERETSIRHLPQQRSAVWRDSG